MLIFTYITTFSYAGIVPMFCDDVFKQIEAKKAEGDKTEFEVRKKKEYI